MIKDTTKSKQPKGLFFVFGCFTKETQKKNKNKNTNVHKRSPH